MYVTHLCIRIKAISSPSAQPSSVVRANGRARAMSFIANDAGWREHVQGCRSTDCFCRSFLLKFPEFEKLYPLDPEGSEPGTWVWFATPGGSFQWVCLACEASNKTRHLDRCTTGSGCWKASNLKRHHDSVDHRVCVATFFGRPTTVEHSVPSIDVFKEVVKAFQTGAAPSAGYELRCGHVGEDKAQRLVWCLSEADIGMKREAVKHAEVLQLIRDERHSRLHARFNCVAADDSGDATRGYLGQARDFPPSALGVTRATRAIYKDFCTKYVDPPRGAAVTPIFLEELFDHMRNITEALAIDSAENEIAAAHDMKLDTAAEPAFTPNCKFILRDACHSARRVLGRLFAACGVATLSDPTGWCWCWWSWVGASLGGLVG